MSKPESIHQGRPQRQGKGVCPPSCLKNRAASGKAVAPAGEGAQANAPVLLSPSAKGKGPVAAAGKAGLRAAGRATQSQAVPPAPGKGQESPDSSSSSDSEEEDMAKQSSRPAGPPQKQGATKEADSTSSESNKEEQQLSQSLLIGYLGLSKAPAAPQVQTAASLTSPKPGRRKAAAAASTLTKPGKAALPDVSESDSSDSDTDAEKTSAKQTAESKSSSSGEVAVTTKVASSQETAAGKAGERGASLKASRAKKALVVTQNAGGPKGSPGTPSPYALLSIAQSERESSASDSEDRVTTAAKAPGGQAPGELEGGKNTPSASAKALKATKAPKLGDKENKKQKSSVKRKLAAGDASPAEPKPEKLKSGLETPKKKKSKGERAAGSKEKKKKAAELEGSL
ncbi:uncharacterized protein LOC127033104 [Gopherus flavomarginatus]|uniref:uncharacterized protein LOC127033104 n=1 Tax=Gopherus flavomarginatus TaxID=286002 RepID=UPI0021CC40ED|nr:uncharacterized protein LOC127033104 [Gopherus flavomarginatus]